MHLLGRREITDFDDLTDRRVAIGREGSGTYLTARLLFKVSEVTPREMPLIDTDQALAELKAGRIDAMFYVAGAPVKLFLENVSEADGLALIPITNKSITEFYPRVEIPANVYPAQCASTRWSVSTSAVSVGTPLDSRTVIDRRRASSMLIGAMEERTPGSCSTDTPPNPTARTGP